MKASYQRLLGLRLTAGRVTRTRETPPFLFTGRVPFRLPTLTPPALEPIRVPGRVVTGGATKGLEVVISTLNLGMKGLDVTWTLVMRSTR